MGLLRPRSWGDLHGDVRRLAHSCNLGSLYLFFFRALLFPACCYLQYMDLSCTPRLKNHGFQEEETSGLDCRGTQAVPSEQQLLGFGGSCGISQREKAGRSPLSQGPPTEIPAAWLLFAVTAGAAEPRESFTQGSAPLLWKDRSSEGEQDNRGHCCPLHRGEKGAGCHPKPSNQRVGWQQIPSPS